jgi:ubiquitin-like protein Nedd8
MKIKQLVYEKMMVPPPQLTLLLHGQKMSDEKTASDYALENGATINFDSVTQGC